jgi:hypothetical protein
MFATLLVIACLISSPEDCDEYNPNYDQVSLQECVLYGQIGAQKWVEDHPKYFVKGYRCKIGGIKFKDS